MAHKRRIVGVVGSATAYLTLADRGAISGGTRAVSPRFSLPLKVSEHLPREEAAFVLLTSMTCTRGFTLAMVVCNTAYAEAGSGPRMTFSEVALATIRGVCCRPCPRRRRRPRPPRPPDLLDPSSLESTGSMVTTGQREPLLTKHASSLGWQWWQWWWWW